LTENPARALVVGFGVTGEAVARHLDPATLTVVEDRPTDAIRERAAAAGIELIEQPDEAALARLVRQSDVVVPSPGVPLRHPVYALAAGAGVELVSEVELAFRAATAKVVAVTGTNGKTTVATLIAAMLVESGLRAVAAGNIGLALIDAAHQDVDVLVAEVSSFQLRFTSQFRPAVATWLNVSEDHLDWHPSFEDYVDSKARIWANQTPDDVAIANAGDAVVMAATGRIRSRLVTFGAGGDYRRDDGMLLTPTGDLLPIDALPRRLPTDLANALAASASAIEAGAGVSSCRAVLETFEGLPHRVTLVSDARGVRFYDDSKATTPASVLAAVEGFESVVLIAGGRNKGLDLSVLAAAAPRLRAVVAIGDASDEVEAAFAGKVPVRRADSMDAAVTASIELAQPGDAVLLSPGCASYDWYSSYAERGDDFARAVHELVASR